MAVNVGLCDRQPGRILCHHLRGLLPDTARDDAGDGFAVRGAGSSCDGPAVGGQDLRVAVLVQLAHFAQAVGECGQNDAGDIPVIDAAGDG